MKSEHELLAKLERVKRTGQGRWQALCPGHNDTQASLSIRVDDGKVLAYCHAGCTIEQILAALNLTKADLFLNDRKAKPPRVQHREIEAIYHYTDANGKPFEVVRTQPKGFYQRQPHGKGGYINNLEGITPTLYHRKDLEKAIIYGDTIHIPEGEADCDRLWQLGLVATCNPGGVGKWKMDYSDALIAAYVVILPDNDDAGGQHSQQVARSLHGKAASIKVLELPNLPPKGDVSDWLDAGGTVDQLQQLATEASEYRPQPKGGMLTLGDWRQKITADPPTEDIIQDVLPNASTEYLLLCGRAGIGKTNLALYLAFCLACGMPWFSHKVTKCRVGYLGFEGTPRKLLTRFDKLQGIYGDPGDYLLVERSLPFKLMKRGVDRFLNTIEGLDIVIVDPLRYIVPDDYTKPEAASAFISTLKDCCSQTNTIPILLHHVRKPDRRLSVRPEDLAFEVKGATDYVDAAATVLLLEHARQPRTKDGRFGSSADDRVLHFCKVKDSPAELLPLNLKFNRETLIYEPVTEYDTEEDEVFQ